MTSLSEQWVVVDSVVCSAMIGPPAGIECAIFAAMMIFLVSLFASIPHLVDVVLGLLSRLPSPSPTASLSSSYVRKVYNAYLCPLSDMGVGKRAVLDGTVGASYSRNRTV